MRKNYLFTILITLIAFSTTSLTAQNALKFDGNGDYVTVPNASAPIANKDLSLSFWVYPTNTSPSFPNFDGMAGFRNNSNADFYILHLSATQVEARFRNSTGTNYDILYNNLVPNTWNHFVLTYNGSTLTLYHNGTSVGTNNNATGYITSTTETLYLGSLPFNNTQFYLNGQLDDAALWSKSLTSTEATALYNACSIDLNASGLMYAYECDQGVAGGNNTSITSLLDSKGNANGVFNGLALTGTASNFVAYSKNTFLTLNPGLCNGGNYTTPSGTVLTTSGTYQDTLPGIGAACDTFITINLMLGSHSNNTVINPVECNSYTSPSGNHTWSTSGNYTDTLMTFVGCDSIITINLTINSSNANPITVQECNSYTSPSGNYIWSTSGNYTDTLTNFLGCDSIIIINLMINSSQSSISAQSCDDYTSPSGNYVWTTSGNYTDTITNHLGCDSIVSINLTINNSQSSISAQSCGDYTSPSGNHVWTTSGNYTDTLTNHLGCDSLISINLSLTPLPNLAVTQNTNTLTATQTDANYQWIDCNNGNMPIAGATNQAYTSTISGNYAVIVTVDGCSDTSDCYQIIQVNTSKILSHQIKAFPNPTTGQLQIDMGQTYQDISIQITDMIGQVLQTQYTEEGQLLQLNLAQPVGIYFIKITSNNQRAVLKIQVH